ncbi:S-layer homology domain-containing protein [Bacilliculturomica massiliensis]|uniref:S-layer homology domain-containing protein n=1 Tax=Bacilliculturomica massiliensis TaxID=1917867 RepID=UPI00102F6483|nr:S-layer homology domain-containing protein [Bacilliculturomica massiliensis]
MKCKKCGAELQEGFAFCLQCGEKIDDMSAAAEKEEKREAVGSAEADRDGSEDKRPEGEQTPKGMQSPEEVQRPEKSQKPADYKKRKRRNLLILALAALVLLCASAGAYFWFAVDPPRRFREQMDLGNRFLQENQYEEAVVAFEKAIRLDPKAPEPEIMLAEAYIGLENGDRALEALQNAEVKLEFVEADEQNRLRELMRGSAVKLVLILPRSTEFLDSLLGASMTIEDVVTNAYPNVSLIVNCRDFAEEPSRSMFVVREDGERKQIADAAPGEDGTVVLSYKTEPGDSGQERNIELEYKGKQTVAGAERSYFTPELQEAEIRLEQVDVSDYPTVRLYYQVTDPETKAPVEGLSKNDFTLSELSGGKQLTKEIKNVMQLENTSGLNVEIVADVSGSMSGDKMTTLKRVTGEFSASLQYGAGDRLELMAFDDSIYQICSFTSDIDLIQQCIDGMTTGGSTAFYDAVIAASNRVMLQSGARCLIAFTDGGDNASHVSVQEATKYAKDYSLPLFIIGIGGGIDEDTLKQMAEQTGGFYRHASDVKDLDKIYEKIYTERKKLYMVEYETDAAQQQADERSVVLNLEVPGRYEGAASNTYVPRTAEAGESNIEVINLQETLAAQAEAVEDSKSNIVLDFAVIKGFTETQEFMDYLESALASIGSGAVNDAGKSDIATYIEYAISQSSRGTLEAKSNKVVLSAENTESIFAETERVRAAFEELLADYHIFLNKELKTRARADVLELDLNKPVIIVMEETLPGSMGNTDELLLLIGDNRRTVRITGSGALKLLERAGMLVQLDYLDEGVQVSFADEKGHAIEQAQADIAVSLPAENAIATVFVTREGYSDNWGGQYDEANQSIEFYTSYSGDYKVLENEMEISDIGDLDRSVQQAVRFMLSKGYFGMEEDRFRPSDDLIRYEFTEVLVRMFFALEHGLETGFIDVPSDSAYYNFVASAEQDQIVSGYEDQTFRGGNTITREEMIALCARTLSEKKGYSYPADPGELLDFEDAAAISDWAEIDIALAVREGLIRSGGLLDPERPVTRAEAADLLYKLFMLLYETQPIQLVAEGQEVLTGSGITDTKTAVVPDGMVWAGAAGLTVIAAAAIVVLVRRKKKKAERK